MADEADRELLREQLRCGTQRVTSEDRIIWTVFSIFLATNAILLRIVSVGRKSVVIPIFVAVFGLATSVIWFFIQRRTLAHLTAWEGIVEEIERSLNIPSQFTFSTSINENYKRALPCPRARPLMCLTVGLLFLMWVVFLVLLICKHVG
jgi:hypothetical protein